MHVDTKHHPMRPTVQTAEYVHRLESEQAQVEVGCSTRGHPQLTIMCNARCQRQAAAGQQAQGTSHVSKAPAWAGLLRLQLP